MVVVASVVLDSLTESGVLVAELVAALGRTTDGPATPLGDPVVDVASDWSGESELVAATGLSAVEVADA